MIIIGTSGYHFKDWTGNFYPSKLTSDKWLEYYASNFNILEINTTYYGIPKLASVQRWADQTPDNFKFIVKLNSESTHKRSSGGEEINELLQTLTPLSSKGKLLGLLAQFPPSFHADAVQKDYLVKISKMIIEFEFFVEFRHKSWDSGQIINFCRDHNLNWVTTDLPSLPDLPLSRPAVTGSSGYIRLHGRNKKTWYNPNAGDRYDWNYDDETLLRWFPKLKALEKYAETTYLFFNNCHAGQAVRNAIRMRELLKKQFEVI